MDLNHRPRPYKGRALTTELWARVVKLLTFLVIWPLYLCLLKISRVDMLTKTIESSMFIYSIRIDFSYQIGNKNFFLWFVCLSAG